MRTLNFFDGKNIQTLEEGKDFNSLSVEENNTIKLFTDDDTSITIRSNYYTITEKAYEYNADDIGFGA